MSTEPLPTLLIECHIDTIPNHTTGRWRHDAFAAELDDRRLYGSGVCDMKASAAAAIHGVARLIESRYGRDRRAERAGALRGEVRAKIPFVVHDRLMSAGEAAIAAAILNGEFADSVPATRG